MPKYLVTWAIDIEADSPEEAALEARRIQVDPESIATVFYADLGRHRTVVDVEGGTAEILADTRRRA